MGGEAYLSLILSLPPLYGVPCVPIRVPLSIWRRRRVYRILAAGGLREVAAPTAAKSIFREVSMLVH